MSNILMKCNVSQEERAKVFKEFDPRLEREEEEELSLRFTQYVFYDSWGRKNHRDCFCTRCGNFALDRDEAPGFFKLTHGDEAHCPNCAETIQLYSLGRMRTGAGLKEWQRAAFARKASDGGLLLIAGYATKDYTPYDLRPTVDWNVKSLTYLAQGKRMQWRRSLQNYWNCFYVDTATEWIEAATIEEPFKPAMLQHDGSYWFFGYDALLDSNLKYCQIEEWYHAEGQGWLCECDNTVRQVYKYLARYTDAPQMEMAVKLGMNHAVTELVMEGRKNHRYLNWNAKRVQDFLRMKKQDAKAFIDAGGDIEQLRHCKDALKTGTIRNVQEYLDMVSTMGSMNDLTRCAGCAEKAGTDLRRAVKYIKGQMNMKKNGRPIWKFASAAIGYWNDYLDAAKQLEYDLTDQTVAMPKDLEARHDAASKMVKLQASAEARKKYRNRYKKLKDLYEFELGGLSIIVPEMGEQIVAEGKILHHCVGGYADRHMVGKVDILFLRHSRRPERSFLTIEMEPRKSPRDKVVMRQIHGYQNERYRGGANNSPRNKYAWFLDVWEDWMRNGSQRDKNGIPVLPSRKEQAV